MTRNYDEKRDYYRMTANCPMTFKAVGGTETISGVCLNFSAGGISFQSPRTLPVGTQFEVNITPAMALVPPLFAVIEVVRCIEQGAGYEIASSITEIK